MIVISKHSGKSVFEWRVYRVFETHGGRTRKTQLAKCKTREAAEKVADHFREGVNR